MHPWFRTSDLSFAYQGQAPIITDLCIQVHKASPLAICGRSGVGKTTLLNLIAGTLNPTSGFAEVNGIKVLKPSSDRALVFQNHNLFPWLTASANIEFGMRYKGLNRRERHAKAIDLLQQFDMIEAAELYPHQLSGGMRQRVGIARALAVSPGCLLLDEPFAALDPATKISIVSSLNAHAQSNDMRIIVVSHDVEDVMEFCGQVLMLQQNAGVRLIEIGKSDPQTEKRNILAEYHDPQSSAHTNL